MNALVNLLAMQISWFACVLGAAHQLPWLGVFVALAVVALHLLRSAQRRVELQLIISALLMGLVIDSALAGGGWIGFTSGTLMAGVTTPWMLGLWIAFATTLTSSLNWLMLRPPLAVLFGAIGGPAAYWSGAKLGALTLTQAAPALAAIGACWAVAMAIFVVLVRRYATSTRVAA